MIPLSECKHETLQFASGDYYIICRGCHSTWMRSANDGRPEYATVNGKLIGASPESANLGAGTFLSGELRKKID